MIAVDLICCPYDSGRRDWRCGLGPKRILQQGAVARIQSAGTDVRLVEIETQVSYETEVSLVFEAQRQIAKSVAMARGLGRFPLVLGGNCNTAVGGVSGIGGARLGVIWFDAHGEFCTPETTESGFLDGMGLAMMVGRCWRHVLSTVPGYAPIPEAVTALIGARDLDPLEAEDLENSAITKLRVEDIRTKGVGGAFGPFLERLAREVDQVYLHIDADVHDPGEAPANYYNAPGGLRADEVREAIAFIGRHIHVAGGGLGSYDPSFDPDGKTAEIAVGVLESLIAASQVVR
ncbi:MAG: arginase family protein [Aestuariivirga sp.]|nr:arginase family protein [Aestuariivirga sp.]